MYKIIETVGTIVMRNKISHTENQSWIIIHWMK